MISDVESVPDDDWQERACELAQVFGEAVRESGECSVLAGIINGRYGVVDNAHLYAALSQDLVQVIHTLLSYHEVDARHHFGHAFWRARSVPAMENLLASIGHVLPSYLKSLPASVEDPAMMRYLIAHPDVRIRGVDRVARDWRGGRVFSGFRADCRNNAPLRRAAERRDYEMMELLLQFRETDASEFIANRLAYEPSAVAIAVSRRDARALDLIVRGRANPEARLKEEFRGRRAEFLAARAALTEARARVCARTRRARSCFMLYLKGLTHAERTGKLGDILARARARLGAETMASLFADREGDIYRREFALTANLLRHIADLRLAQLLANSKTVF